MLTTRLSLWTSPALCRWVEAEARVQPCARRAAARRRLKPPKWDTDTGNKKHGRHKKMAAQPGKLTDEVPACLVRRCNAFCSCIVSRVFIRSQNCLPITVWTNSWKYRGNRFLDRAVKKVFRHGEIFPHRTVFVIIDEDGLITCESLLKLCLPHTKKKWKKKIGNLISVMIESWTFWLN